MTNNKSNCKKFCALSTGTQGKPWRVNWEDDTQPHAGKTTGDYISIARDLRIQMLEKVKDLLSKAPDAVLKDDGVGTSFRCYRLSDMDQLIAEIKANPQDDRFLKSNDSATRKLWDCNVGFDPSRIKDYLRFQILSDNVSEIVVVRANLLNDPDNITSYKDQFRRPCEEGGHRAFKFHMLLELDGKSILAEGQLAHRSLEEYQLPKSLRNSERGLLEASRSGQIQGLRPTFQQAFGEAADNLQSLRRALNYTKCGELGLNALLDDDINPDDIIREALEQSNSGSRQTRNIMGHSPTASIALLELGVSPLTIQ